METLFKGVNMKIAIAIAAVGLIGSVNAAPYYVGENLKPNNNITLNFQDTMVKKTGTVAGTDKANIAAFELRGAYNVTNNVPVAIGLPFYMASKDLTGTSRNGLGNGWLGLSWTDAIPTEDREMTWGYNIGLTTYLPSTGDKLEAASVAAANPTTDYYRFARKTFSIVPTAGVYMMADQFSAKLNASVGYGRDQATGVTSRNEYTYPVQLGLSYHAMPNLHLNAEYNTIYGNKAAFGTKKFRHAATPSISGNYEAFMGSLYASLPLDSTTRDIHNVSFGLNAGYSF